MTLLIFAALVIQTGSSGVSVCDGPVASYLEQCAPDYCSDVVISTYPAIEERRCNDGRVEDWDPKVGKWVPWGPQGKAVGPPK